MRHVMQTFFAGSMDDPSAPPGNCMQACFASLLDLELDQVPHFLLAGEERDEAGNPAWWLEILKFVQSQGFCIVITAEPIGALGVMSGTSPRGNFGHVVIAHGSNLEHDPHPDNTGVLDPSEWWYLVPVDPAKHKHIEERIMKAIDAWAERAVLIDKEQS